MIFTVVLGESRLVKLAIIFVPVLAVFLGVDAAAQIGSDEPVEVFGLVRGNLQYYPDGSKILGSSGDAPVAMVIDTQTGIPLKVFAEPLSELGLTADLSMDGSRIALRWDNTVQIRDGETFEVITTIVVQGANSAVLSPDGSNVLIGQNGQRVLMYNANTGALIKEFPGIGVASAYSPDGEHFAAVVNLINIDSGEIVARYSIAGDEFQSGGLTPTGIAFDGDGDRVVVWESEGFGVLNAFTGAEISRRRSSTFDIEFSDLSPDGTLVVSGGDWRDPAALYHADTGEFIERLADPVDQAEFAGPSSMVFSQDGSEVAVDANGFIRFWDPTTFENTRSIGFGNRGNVSTVTPHPDGERIFIHGALYNRSDGTLIRTFVDPGNSQGFTQAAFTPDGELLVLGNAILNNTTPPIDVYGVDTGVRLFQSQFNRLESLDVSSDSKYFAGAGRGEAGIWELESGALLHELELPNEDDGIKAVAFHPNGAELWGGSRMGHIAAWDVVTGDMLFELNLFGFVPEPEDKRITKGRAPEIEDVAFMPDGTRFIVISNGAAARSVDTRTLDTLAEFQLPLGAYDLAVSPTDNLIATVGDSNENCFIKFWEVDTGRLVHTLIFGDDFSTCFDEVEFTADGQEIFTSIRDVALGFDVSALSQGGRDVTPINLGDMVNSATEGQYYTDYELDFSGGAPENIFVRVTQLSGGGNLRLFGRNSQLPTFFRFDQEGVTFDDPAVDEFFVSPPFGESLFLSIFDTGGRNTNGRFILEVIDAGDRFVSGILPTSASNGGTTTVQVRGVGLEEGMEIQLQTPQKGLLASATASVVEDNSVYFPIDLTGVSPQLADVNAVWPDSESRTLEQTFEVTEGGIGPRFEATVTVPPVVRRERFYTGVIEYGNTGDVDMPAPLIVLTTNASVRWDRSDPWNTSGRLNMLAVSTTGPIDILRPGETHRREFQFTIVPTGVDPLQFDINEFTDEGPLDWDNFPGALRPFDVTEDEWMTAFPPLQDFLGVTWPEYQQALRDLAVEVQDRGGFFSEPRDLAGHLYREENDLPNGYVSGTVYDADTANRVLSTYALIVSEDGTFARVAPLNHLGEFSVSGVPLGSYSISVNGYLTIGDSSVEIVDAANRHALQIFVSPNEAPDPFDPGPANEGDVHLVSGEDGSAYMTWSRNGVVWTAQFLNGRWTNVQQIPEASGNNPKLSLLPKAMPTDPQQVVAVWETRDETVTEFVNNVLTWALGTVENGEIAWSSPQALTSDMNDDSRPQLAIDAGGIPVVIWLQKDTSLLESGDDTDVYFTTIDLDSVKYLDPEVLEEFAKQVAACSQFTLPFRDANLAPSIPMMNRVGIAVQGQLCEETKDCTEFKNSGQLTGQLMLPLEVLAVNLQGQVAVDEKFAANEDTCRYVFVEQNLSGTVGVQVQAVSPSIRFPQFPLLAFKIGAGIQAGLTGTLKWTTPVPALPSSGMATLDTAAMLFVKVALITDALVEGTGTGTLTAKWDLTPPNAFELVPNSVCFKIKGDIAAAFGTLNYSWEYTVDCTKSLTPGAIPGEFETVHFHTGDSYRSVTTGFDKQALPIEALLDITVDPFTGTGGVYEGTPVLSGIASDLFNDGPPVVVSDGAGNLLMIWTKDAGEFNTSVGSRVVASSYDPGTGWSTPVSVDDTINMNGVPAAAIDSNGTAWTAWAFGDSSGLSSNSSVEEILAVPEETDIAFSRWNGQTWDARTLLASLPGRDDRVALASGANGNMLAAWRNTDSVGMRHLYVSEWTEASAQWSTPEQLSTNISIGPLSVAFLDTARGYLITWTEDEDGIEETGDDNRIYFAVGTPGTFSPVGGLADILFVDLPIASKSTSNKLTFANGGPLPEDCDCEPEDCEDTAPSGNKQGDEMCEEDDEDPDGRRDRRGRDSSDVINATDPNEKIGPLGQTEDQLVPAGSAIHYTIYFENKSDASAPAQEVFINDSLMYDAFDLDTIRLVDFSWGATVVSAPPNVDEYETRVTINDYRPDVAKQWWVDISVRRNFASRTLDWTFRTLDPETGRLPEDPFAGFLPPNDESGRGQGYVSFEIKIKEDLEDGEFFENSATIVFDVEEPIQTNFWFNIVGQVMEGEGEGEGEGMAEGSGEGEGEGMPEEEGEGEGEGEDDKGPFCGPGTSTGNRLPGDVVGLLVTLLAVVWSGRQQKPRMKPRSV